MKIHNDQLARVQRLTTSLGEEIRVGDGVEVSWGPDHTYYVVVGPDGTRFLNPAHVVSVHLETR